MILLVDDESYFMDVYREWLDRHVDETYLASSVEEAIAIFGREGAHVRAVVLDVMMSPGAAFDVRGDVGAETTCDVRPKGSVLDSSGAGGCAGIR